MIEVTTNAAAKDAIARAHAERAMALRAVWSWMLPRRKPRLAGCPA